jgi:hypothetical protein
MVGVGPDVVEAWECTSWIKVTRKIKLVNIRHMKE